MWIETYIMINLWPTDPLPPPPPQLHHKSLHMDIQLFVGNLYVSNKSEDSIPQLLLDLCSKQKNFSNVENEDMSCILYMYTYYTCMYVSYILYLHCNQYYFL